MKKMILNKPTEDNENIENLLKTNIKCFQHCVKSERLLCFKIPDMCPTCSKLLNTNLTTFLIPPFILPTPLTITTNEQNENNLPPYSLLLQPTNGNYENFLLSQQQQNNQLDKIINDFGDLHIGITNSKSEIFDFDLNGLNRNSLKWYKIPSIVIKLNNQHQQQQQQHQLDHPFEYQPDFEEHQDENLKFLFYNYYYLNFNKWDFILDNYWYNQSQTKWSSKMYDELRFNCLDFVIQFLIDYDYKFQNFTSNSISSVDNLKYLVSNQLIEPEFIKCFKYLNLLIKIKTNNYFIESIPSTTTTTTTTTTNLNKRSSSTSSSSSSIKSTDELIENHTNSNNTEHPLKINQLTTIATRM